MRRLAALGMVLVVALAAAPHAAARADDSGENEGLFTLRSSDVTGPTPVAAGEGIWRTLAIRNSTDEYRLTIELAGSGADAAWIAPAVDRVELAPGQQQIVRFSVAAPADATGLHHVGITATVVEAESVLIIGVSPVVTAERRALEFDVNVEPGVVSAPLDSQSDAEGDDTAIGGGSTIELSRTVAALGFLTFLLAVLWFAPRLVGRTARITTARRAARELTRETTSKRRSRTPRGRQAELVSDARRAATSVLAQRAARARARAESAAADAHAAQLAAIEARDRSLARLSDERLADEATRQLAHRVEHGDKIVAARVRVESRTRAKQARRDEARSSTRAQLDAARAADVDRQTFAELSRASWLQARTEGARARMQREPLMLVGFEAGAEPLAFEARIVDRPTPPPPNSPTDPETGSETDGGVEDGAPAGVTGSKRASRKRRERVEVVELDVTALNRVLEARRARDGFDDRTSTLSAR